jgi:hypothetical protein
VQRVHDGNQLDQGQEWILPAIFIPYWTEYRLGVAVGSLWVRWIAGMLASIEGQSLPPDTEAMRRCAGQQQAVTGHGDGSVAEP